MAWKKYEVMHTRTVQSHKIDETVDVTLVLGRVFTGKQKVMVGYFAKVSWEGLDIIREGWSLYRSFREATDEFCRLGYTLNVNGRHEGYYESGLSENVGFGYLSRNENQKSVLMIDEMDRSTLMKLKNDTKMVEKIISGLTITAIVRVENIFIDILPDNIWQIDVESQGYNFNGLPVTLNFVGKYSGDEIEVIRSLYSKGRVLRISGEYAAMNFEDGGFCVFSPDAVPLSVEEADILKDMFD